MRFLPLLSLLFSACGLVSQAPATPEVSADNLIRKVVATDLDAAKQDRSRWQYHAVAKIPAPEKSRTIVQAADCDLTYLTALDGHPLSSQELAAEDKRVKKFIGDPGQQQKARKETDADNKKTVELLAMLPDAFLFRHAETNGDIAKLTFTPNPNFVSHSSESFVMHKMEGYVLVNTRENRLVAISGHLTQKVEFGGGLLGHLDAGGSFDVRREEVAPDHWAIVRVKVDMNGRILFFKTIAEKQDETDSDFQKIPDTTTLTNAEAMAKNPAKSSESPQ